jgi:hypothetical protein
MTRISIGAHGAERLRPVRAAWAAVICHTIDDDFIPGQ